jgi:hypothetical protein
MSFSEMPESFAGLNGSGFGWCRPLKARAVSVMNVSPLVLTRDACAGTIFLAREDTGGCTAGPFAPFNKYAGRLFKSCLLGSISHS